MNLCTAKLCVSCEEIYEGSKCPKCTSSQFVLLIQAMGSLVAGVNLGGRSDIEDQLMRRPADRRTGGPVEESQ